MDRAPVVELNYNRADLFKAMYEIAKGDGGGILEYEKMVVTKEIEDYTDSTMDVSLRKQQIAFKIYNSFKQMYGEGNALWQPQIRRIFGIKKESWLRSFVRSLVGDGNINRQELVRQISFKFNMSPRTAQRNITEYLEVDEIFTNKKKQGDISIKSFGVDVK
jgi:hypothetical protein